MRGILRIDSAFLSNRRQLPEFSQCWFGFWRSGRRPAGDGLGKTNLKHKLARTIALVSTAACGVGGLQAHNVVWWENPEGYQPLNTMTLFFGRDWCGDYDSSLIGIVPSTGEPCTVVVNVNTPSSPAISVRYLGGSNTGNAVWIAVDVQGAGPGTVNTTVTGEWHATGSPDPTQCNATNPNPFSVPVVVKTPLQWSLMKGLQPGTVDLDTGGYPWGLRWANSLNGPWVNVGTGTKFTLGTDMNEQFFKGTKRLGSGVSGLITDPLGHPQTGVTFTLPYGGPATTTDSYGNFTLPWMPRGMNLIAIGKPLTFTDPGTGSNRTENVAVNVVVPSTNVAAVAQLKVDLGVGSGPVTNLCTCTPWCAIGTGSLNGVQTPVYYAGGAFPPQSGPASCDPPQVTVTPPGGAAYSIKVGSDLHQNSGSAPASGTWTVTTTVCGQSKTCTVTVP